ncbi:MAG: co-chaperone DjlA [Pseudomonadota bacterium]
MIVYLIIIALGGLLIYNFSGNFTQLLAGKMGSASRKDVHHIQDLFFKAVFPLLGYVAKRDGPVNQQEVKRTEMFMEKLNLDAHHKKEAIRLFKSGGEPQFNVNETISGFSGVAKKHPNLVQILLVYLINIARVDGLLVKQEIDAVEKIAIGLGYSSITFTHLLQMISSQNKFADIMKTNSEFSAKDASTNKSSTQQSATEDKERPAKEAPAKEFGASNKQHKPPHVMENCEEKTKKFNSGTANVVAAYDVLDLSPTASNSEIKKAYRTLASQYHPDKLTGEGLPPFMIESTTECFKTIQAAYEYIYSARKLQTEHHQR